MWEVASLLPEAAFQWAETTQEYFNTMSLQKTRLIFKIGLQQKKVSLWTSEVGEISSEVHDMQ